jgi:hypothetical protein
MATEMGEYVVGAYLRLCEHCDVVDYNARSPKSGLEGLSEIDVVGLRFADHTAFICEVATHLDGLNYGSYGETAKRVLAKYERQRRHSSDHLSMFTTTQFMLWAPRVPVGALTQRLAQANGLVVVTNEDYAKRVLELRRIARSTTRDIGNPFFRALQILEHLKSAG